MELEEAAQVTFCSGLCLPAQQELHSIRVPKNFLVLKCNNVIQPVLFRGKTFHTSFCNDLAAITYNWVVDTKGSPSCGPGHRIQKDTCCIFWDSPRPTDLSHFSIVTSVKLARLDSPWPASNPAMACQCTTPAKREREKVESPMHGFDGGSYGVNIMRYFKFLRSYSNVCARTQLASFRMNLCVWLTWIFVCAVICKENSGRLWPELLLPYPGWSDDYHSQHACLSSTW